MKKIATLLGVVFLIVSCSSTQPGGTKPPIVLPPDADIGEDGMGFPKTVEEYLGAETINLLGKVTEGKSFTVGSKKADSGDLFGGYPILGKGKDLNKDQVEVLKKLLLDPATYIFPTAKKVLIAPEYGIKLGEVIVLFDTTNLLIAVPSGGKQRIEDYDPVKFIVQGLIKDLF